MRSYPTLLHSHRLRSVSLQVYMFCTLQEYECCCAKLTPLNACVSLQALHSALHTFDMIESVLVRIEELTEAKESS